MITASNRNTVKLNEDSGCPLSLQEVPQRRGGESGHSTLWWFRINLTTETETVRHSAVWAELKLPESIDVNHILNLHADAEVQKKTLFCCLLLSIFCLQYFHISSLPLWTSCRGQQRCDPSLASHSDTLIIESVYVSFIWNVCLMLSRLVTYNTVSVSLQTVELQIKKPTNLPKTSTLSEMLLLGRY